MYLIFLACVLIEPPGSQELPIAKAEAGCSCSKGCVCTFPACQCIDNFGEPQRCDNAKCGCAQRPKKEEHNYRWVPSTTNPDQCHLMDGPAAPNGVQVGTWVYGRWYGQGAFFPYDAKTDSWGPRLHAGFLPPGIPKPPAKEKRPETHPLPEMPKPSQSFMPTFRVRAC